MAAAEEQPEEAPEPEVRTTEELAEETGVSVSTVKNIKAAERGGLGPEVRSGAMSPTAAARQARAVNKPVEEQDIKPPSKVERLEAEKEALIVTLDEERAKAVALEEQVRFHQEQASPEAAGREATLNNQRAENRALQGQVQEWMGKCNDLQAANKKLTKELAQAKKELKAGEVS